MIDLGLGDEDVNEEEPLAHHRLADTQWHGAHRRLTREPGVAAGHAPLGQRDERRGLGGSQEFAAPLPLPPGAGDAVLPCRATL